MARNDVQGQCGSTFSLVLLYQWAQVRPCGLFHHNAESLFSIYLSSLSSHAIHLVFSTSPSFSSEWLRYAYTDYHFQTCPWQLNVGADHHRAMCFLAHLSLLVLLSLDFLLIYFFASRISPLFFFWYDVSQCQGQFSASEHRDFSVLLKRAATGSAVDKFCFHSAWPPIHPRCTISTMAPCYRISVLLKRCLLSLRGINYSSAVCHTAVHVWQTNSGINAELIHYWETHQPAEAQLCRRISVAFFIRLNKLEKVSFGSVLHHTKLKKQCKCNSWFHTDCINTV